MANFLKDYQTVEIRLCQFRAKHPEGRVITELVSNPDEFGVCRYKATLYRNHDDKRPMATGHAVERFDEKHQVNRQYHEENAESGAVGRALANAGLPAKRNGPQQGGPA